MSTRSFVIGAKWSRRMADPNFDGAETHFVLVPASELPVDLPLDANPRKPQINRPVYRAIGRSLRQEDDSRPGTFHLKHRGITMIASSVTKAGTRADGLDELEIHFPASGNFGIADGGHSYEIIIEARKADAIPDNEFIKLEIITGLPEGLVTDIAGGRNTSMQVHAKSLLDLKDEFQFLKDILTLDGWDHKVAWHEGDDGDIDVVDLIAIMSCFDIATFPNRNQNPVDAYRRKSSMLERFQSDPHRYRRLTPVVRDILYLHDWIALDSENRWQAVGGATGSGGKYGRLDMVESTESDSSSTKRSKPPFQFPFIPETTSTRRLRRPALFPVLASFRQMLVENDDTDSFGDYKAVKWKDGFDSVLSLWDAAGGMLLRTFYEHWDETGRDLHASGRSPALWGSIHKELTLLIAEHAASS